MTKLEKEIQEFKDINWELWRSTFLKVHDEISDKQSMRCCCGRLATGLHEMHCRKLSKLVEKETFKRLKDKQSIGD